MIENEKQRTELSEFGEFGLIDHLTKNIKLKHKSSITGVGDDAAVIEPGGKQMLVTTDLLIEGIHFDMTYMPLKHLGYKAAVVNFSDIIAMNGLPKQMTIGISASNRYSVEALEEIYSGIYLACEKYNVDVVGGDTTSSVSNLFIAITVIGEIDKSEIVYRNTAKENDLICVSGDLGGAYMGLLLLEREKETYKADPNMQPELSGFDYILGRQLKPEARMDIINLLRDNKITPSSMIDISDGLASEIKHICKNSNLGCSIYEEKIPINIVTVSMAEEFKIDPTIAALSGGEDYELLFTISQADYDKIKNLEEITVIGHMTNKDAGESLISRSGTSIQLKAQGWDAMNKYV
ncbi:MAG: thiamine-phosphate kinase [Bacteroidetes bacterium]|nr:thiamine-phosphate kinase [Bacteroidota bacterium]